jgi:hypothetical protein
MASIQQKQRILAWREKEQEQLLQTDLKVEEEEKRVDGSKY